MRRYFALFFVLISDIPPHLYPPPEESLGSHGKTCGAAARSQWFLLAIYGHLVSFQDHLLGANTLSLGGVYALYTNETEV